jgi:hypothetical protein
MVEQALNFPDHPTKGDQYSQNELLFVYDGYGWSKQLLSAPIVISPEIADDRLLPIDGKDNDLLKYMSGKWIPSDVIDSGEY